MNQCKSILEITHISVKDIRFHTSKNNTGSDARSKDPDYSCIYIQVYTTDPQIIGIGTVFTLGRGNSGVHAIVKEQLRHIRGLSLDYIINNFNALWRNIVNDGQLCWNGPEKGMLHQANAGIINALWDIWAKYENKPVWKLIVDLPPDKLINTLNFDHIEDAITKDEALHILESVDKKQTDINIGYPVYLTCGWSGYSNEKLTTILQQSLKQGITGYKMKVGNNIENDCKKAEFIRDIISYDNMLSMDANGVWNKEEAITNMNKLKQYKPYWIEEPTHPDDIISHIDITKSIYPIKVATGEQCSNKVLFKQFIQNKGLSIVQTDIQRLAGINEWFVVMLMCKKYNIPFCLHSGGIGLVNLGVHLCMIDYMCISQSTEGRYAEYIDELTEHYKYPVQLENGKYKPPKSLGFGVELKEESILEYEFPNGKYWTTTYGKRVIKDKEWVL